VRLIAGVKGGRTGRRRGSTKLWGAVGLGALGGAIYMVFRSRVRPTLFARLSDECLGWDSYVFREQL